MDESFPPSEVSGRGTEKNNLFKIVEGKEFNVYRNSDCEVKVKAGLCEGRVKAVAMGAQRQGSQKGGKENMCKADVRKGLEDGLAMRLPLLEPREIYKDKLETDNRSNIGSEFSFEIDLPGKRDRSTIYRLNLIKLYRRKPELAKLVMENSSEEIDSEILYSLLKFFYAALHLVLNVVLRR
ncbi:uncharacterized protein TNCV_2945621 [Trichonephila clavipes]|nr:uncharacterized protein TNCV_2945621 [Trichonephila clavipes]